MGFVSKLMTAWLVLVSSGTALAQGEMTFPLTFNVYQGSTRCNGDIVDSGTITYLAPLPEPGAFCENSITSVDSDGKGTMVDTTMYTKINIVSCDAYPVTGYVFMDVYLCYDSGCGNCEQVPIAGQLILPTFNTGANGPFTVSVDQCWGISSASAQMTTFQQFVDTADSDAIQTYWKTFASRSCIGDSIVESDLNQNGPASDAKPPAVATAPAVAGGSSTTWNAKITATAMVLLIAAFL